MDVTVNVKDNSTTWIITVSKIENHGGDIALNENKIKYLLFDKCDVDIWESGYIRDIRYSPSPKYNITWYDIDNNHLLSIGDQFTISKSTPDGTITPESCRFGVWSVSSIYEMIWGLELK